MQNFISEDDLKTFDGWLNSQGVDAVTMTAEELARSRQRFFDVQQQVAARSKVGLMKLRPIPGEYRYAVAVREPTGLWIALWIRRSRKGEFFIFQPTTDRAWDAHASYHLDGNFHLKSYDRIALTPRKLQPLNGAFRGCEHLGAYFGYAPKSVGAVCDPKAFSGIVELPPGILGPRHGGISIDLVEPETDAPEFSWREIVARHVFRDFNPWLVITVGSSN